MDVVSQVLSARARQADGLQNTLAASLAAHLGLVALVALGPGAWWTARPTAAPESVMTISLGGAPGPRTGMTQLGGRPIQEAVEARRAIEPVRPPAAKAPEMIEPKKTAPKKTETKSIADAKDPRSRTPTKGDEVRQGSTVADTGVRGQGFGLSGGGGGTGGYLDVANFCCPEYLAHMVDTINQRWDYRQQAAGRTVMKFIIQRDGQLTNIEMEKSSGYPALDLMANRALVLTKQLPPLPGAFSEPSLTVHLVFEYQRQ